MLAGVAWPVAVRELPHDRTLQRRVGLWVLVLLMAAALLYARYDWSVDGGFFARRGFALSLYLLVILLPTVYYLLLRMFHSWKVALAVSVATFVVFTLPYRLFGLDSSYYYGSRPQWYVPAKSFAYPSPFPQGLHFPVPTLQFFPGGALRAFPAEWVFMPLLFAAGVGLVWLAWWLRRRRGFHLTRRLPVLLTIAFAVICAQAAFHSSIRAPYTYTSVFHAPQSAQRWFLVYHFPDGSGATTGDQFVYSPVEDYFQGAPRFGDNTVVRRPFSFYVASQFSYFANDFYVWLALNCLFWLAAVFAVGRLVTRLANPRTGVIAGALTVFGPGFLAFVATPSMYMQNYAAAAIALCAFEDLVARPPGGRPRQYALFAGVLALCSLVYDLEPLYLVLLAYGVARRVPWRPLLASLVAALVLFEGFSWTVRDALSIKIDPSNNEQIGQSLKALRHLVLHPHLSTWSATVVNVSSAFVQEWFHAYFVIPAVLALFGWRFLRDRPQKVLVATLFIVSFLLMALFYIGGTTITETPRILYPYFVGVYLPAALAIDRLADWLRRALTRDGVAGMELAGVPVATAAAVAVPCVAAAAMAVLVNIDLFGHPTLYFEFFTNGAPAFLPR